MKFLVVSTASTVWEIGDGLGVLTFEVEQFSVLFEPGRRSARAWRTVCTHSVLRVFVVFLRAFAFDPVLL
jgi:hypothetical protein